MQEQRSANGALPELSFFHSFASSDSGMDPQSYWDHMPNPSQIQPSNCVVSFSDGSTSYLNLQHQEGHSSNGLNFGQSSSSGACDLTNQNNSKNDFSGAALVLGERQYELLDNLSLNNLNGVLRLDQNPSGSLLMASSSAPSNLITNLEVAGSNGDVNNDDDCQVIGHVDAFRFGSSNDQSYGTSSYSHPIAGMPSESGVYSAEGANSSSRGRHLSSKRKMQDAIFGQSSGSGSSNHMPNVGSSLWQGTTISHNATSGVPLTPGNDMGINLEGPRLGLSIGESISDSPLSLGTPGDTDISVRNLRLRINTSHQQDGVPVTFSSTQIAGGSSNVLSSQRSLRLPPVSNSFDLCPSNVAEDESFQRPIVSSLRRNSQSRGPRVSSSRAGSSSSAIPGESVSFQFQEPYRSSVPGIISQHPMSLPATEMGSSSQNTGNWSSAAKNVGILSAASSSHGGSRSGFSSSAPPLIPHHHSPHPIRLPEYSRRSLITPPGIGAANQNTSHNLIHSGPYSSLPEITFPSISANHDQHRFHARSAVLLERHLGRTVGIPHPTRSLAAASEGRSQLVSEIRNVLHRMRRGEALRVEDLMILDQSGFFGMTDLHDRHRDMRLDVDNMSYEELLALEERIGNVSTGLSEETISSLLKQRTYININTHTRVEEEPCCICQEEYNDGQDLGILECGHEFHSICIKQWLMQKNLCPICKTTGLNK